MANCEAAQIYPARGLMSRRRPQRRASSPKWSFQALWLLNQRHHHRNRQQSHCGNQNVVAPAGNHSKHSQSPGNKITATWERLQFRCTTMGPIHDSSTPRDYDQNRAIYPENRGFLGQVSNSQRPVKTSRL